MIKPRRKTQALLKCSAEAAIRSIGRPRLGVPARGTRTISALAVGRIYPSVRHWRASKNSGSREGAEKTTTGWSTVATVTYVPP